MPGRQRRPKNPAAEPATERASLPESGGLRESLDDLNYGLSEEGRYGAPEEQGFFGGLFQDLSQMMAKAELASRFDIVGNDFDGELAPNQVSQEEFDRIATMYSDIRMGSTNIGFQDTGDADDDMAFRMAAMGDIADILTTREGRGLLDEIAYGTSMDGDRRSVTLGNASSPGHAETDGAMGEQIAHVFDGTGVDTRVNYAAGVDFDLSADNDKFENADFRSLTSDQVLFHELVHAQHYVQGMVAGSAEDFGAYMYEVGEDGAKVPLDHDVHEEEYATVGLSEGSDYTENEYRRQRALVTGEDIPQRQSYYGPNPRTD